MKLYLVRHGETDWNVSSRIQGQTDTPLNEAGRSQAAELAAAIAQRGLCLDVIYTSRMKRALETAQIVARELQIPVQELSGIEEIDFGKWEGHTWRQVKELFGEEYEVWHENRRYEIPPEGESYQQLLQRVIPALQSVLEEGKDVLAVTHSAVIMALLSCLCEKPFQDMKKNFKTGNAEIVEIDGDTLKNFKF